MNTTSTTSKRVPTCFYCNKRGHVKSECWHNPQNKNNQIRRENKAAAGPASSSSGSNATSNMSADVQQLLMTTLSKLHLKQNEQGEWYVDSGAAAHITGDTCNLSSVFSYLDQGSVVTGDGSHHTISHIGNAQISLGCSSIPLKNVLVVPSVKKNIISVSKLIDDTHSSVEFTPSSVYVKDARTKKTFAEGTRKGDICAVAADVLFSAAGCAVAVPCAVASSFRRRCLCSLRRSRLCLFVMAELMGSSKDAGLDSGSASKAENVPIQVTSIRLTKDNYLSWSTALEIGITSRGRLSYITGDKPAPLKSDPQWATWALEDSQVKVWIINSVSSDIQPLILRKPTSFDMWTVLAKMYGRKKRHLRTYQIKRSIYSLTQGDLSVVVFYATLKTKWEEFDYHVTDEWKCGSDHSLYWEKEWMDRTFLFLGGLRDEFEAIHSQILNGDEIPGIEEVYARVESKEQRGQVMHLTIGSVPSAFVSRASGTVQRPARRCTHFNKLGHSADFCWDLHPEKRLVRGRPPSGRRCPSLFDSSQGTPSSGVKTKLSPNQLKELQAYIGRLSTTPEESSTSGGPAGGKGPGEGEGSGRVGRKGARGGEGRKGARPPARQGRGKGVGRPGRAGLGRAERPVGPGHPGYRAGLPSVSATVSNEMDSQMEVTVSNEMDSQMEGVTADARDHLFGQVYVRKEKATVEDVVEEDRTNPNPAISLYDPSPSNEELPIALRKGTRSCTSHPIQKFVSYAKLNKGRIVNEPETLVNSSLDSTTSLDSLPSSSQQNDPPIDNRFSVLVYSRRSVPTAAPRQSQRIQHPIDRWVLVGQGQQVEQMASLTSYWGGFGSL
ncbi:hypothetical protein EJ110_NYTH24012 [Nymphaea thermarum]|nr:hypothetical protein EJ110_NYTH24012 [Nymphaea thermarum]